MMRKTHISLDRLRLVCIIGLLVVGCTNLQFQESLNVSTPTATKRKGFIVKLPQKAFWNSILTVTVEAPYSTSCELSYISPSGSFSKAAGLGRTRANKSGVCMWSWKIDPSGKTGTGRLIVTIGGLSETHFVEIRSAH